MEREREPNSAPSRPTSTARHASVPKSRPNDTRARRTPVPLISYSRENLFRSQTGQNQRDMKTGHVVHVLLVSALAAMCRAHPSSKPHTTIFLHGLNGHANDFNQLMARMKTHFGTEVVYGVCVCCLCGGKSDSHTKNCEICDQAPPMHSLPLYEGIASLRTPLATQRDSIIEYLTTNAAKLNLTQGFNLVAHSQGALLSRAVIQALPESMQVINYVSMAGPHLGQWGMCVMGKKELNSTIVKVQPSPSAAPPRH